MSVTSEKIPYLKCPNDGLLVINRATLVLSTSRMCPLQFEGAGNTNVEASCKNPATLVNQDATTILKALWFKFLTLFVLQKKSLRIQNLKDAKEKLSACLIGMIWLACHAMTCHTQA